ncbi:MAG: CPBP family intramembrane metalloprotease [Chlamydiia bacterium]|nr:CPBP family intramembrane metalloprotease [Chlamydiia bacterium]
MESSSLLNNVLQTYSHRPSAQTVAIGIGIALARIGAAQLCTRYIPMIKASQGSLKLDLAGALTVTSGLAAPFLEEHLFRKNINKDTPIPHILLNAIVFGAVHGLIPGSSQRRISRVFMSTIGGVFYGSAQKLTGDIWAPLIAHLMYNSFQLRAALLLAS